MIYILNVAEDELGEDNEMVKKVKEFAKANGNETVKICAKIEEDLCDLDDEEKEINLKNGTQIQRVPTESCVSGPKGTNLCPE